jgi:hypothetical protein
MTQTTDPFALALGLSGIAVPAFLVVPIVLASVSRRKARYPDSRESKRTVPFLLSLWLLSCGWLAYVAYTLLTFKMTRLF